MQLIQKQKQAGFSFIEIMIALAINAVVLLALIGVFSSNIGHYNKASNMDLLMQQLQSAMQVMTDDIRRAGYWGNARTDIGTSQNNNPFMASGADITVGGTGNNCILFTYDYNGNGTLPTISSSIDDERYGFRLVNQILQTRPPGATFSCSAASANWENVTNSSIIQITALTFTLNSTTVPVGATTNRMTVRSVDISLTGRLANDTSVTKTITQHVRIRNDKYVP